MEDSLLLPPVGVWAVSSPIVADQSLNSAMHHRLGRPLPYQQANAPQVHPEVIARSHLLSVVHANNVVMRY